MKINNPNRDLRNCPFCGEKPELSRVGDNKQFLVYRCLKCRRTPLVNGDARRTATSAREIWNWRCKVQED